MNKRLNLISLTLPIFFEVLLFMLLGNMDTLILGHYSNDAVAAVGVANQIINIVTIVLGVMATGTGIMVAQYLGAKDKENVLKTINVSLFVNLFFGIILSALLVIFSKQLLTIMNLPKNLMGYGVKFMSIMGGFIFVQALLSTVTTCIRNYGYMIVSMVVTIIMNILNIIFNYVLVFGKFGVPELGVAGSAISTTVSRIIAFLILFFIFTKKIEKEFSFKRLFPFPKETFKQLLIIGIPTAGENLSYNLSQLAVTYMITLLGTAALTTRIYTLNIMMYIYLAAVALGQGTQILVGHMVGAGDKEKAYKTCLKSLFIAMSISFTMAIIFAIFRIQLLKLFTLDKTIIGMAAPLLLITIILEPGRSFNLVIISSLNAAGDVRFPAYMAIISMWAISAGLSYVLGIHFHMGLVGIWIAFTADEWFRGIMMLLRWRSRVWESKDFVSNVSNEKQLEAV